MGKNIVGRETLTRADRPKTATVVAVAVSIGALTIAIASAQAAERPVISGSPVVGETLTSSPPNGDSGLYKWQRCDPALALDGCSDGPRNDPDWTDIPGAEGQHPQFQTYTLTAADLGQFIRVLSHDTSLGAQFTPSLPVGPVRFAAAGAQQSQVMPQHGIMLIGEPLRGTVRYKPPGQKGYTTVTGKTPIAVNSLIDTRRGSVMLTAATGVFGSQTPDKSMEHFGGLFKITQKAEPDAHAVAVMKGALGCGGNGDAEVGRASGGPAAVAAARGGRRLWGRGSGRYATRGRGGTGSVVGTTYKATDKCGGTNFKVSEGLGIKVKDDGREIFLGPGESYFAER